MLMCIALAALIAPADRATVCISTAASLTPSPAPPYASGMAIPSQPPAAIASVNSVGNVPLRSCSSQ